MTTAGALVQFGGGCGAVQTGWNKVGVKISKRRQGSVSQASNYDVFILVFTDGQILTVRGQKVQNLQPQNIEKSKITLYVKHIFHKDIHN